MRRRVRRRGRDCSQVAECPPEGFARLMPIADVHSAAAARSPTCAVSLEVVVKASKMEPYSPSLRPVKMS